MRQQTVITLCMYLISCDIRDELFLYGYRTAGGNIILKTAFHFVPVIDCQCRDEDLITLQTTIIIPSRFKVTFAELMFAVSSTCFVPKLTGGIKIQVRMPHSYDVFLKEALEEFFLRTILFIKEAFHLN